MHLYILIFWKGKTKNKFAKNKRFLMWKTTFVASGYICFAVYFDFIKVIFWLSPKLYFGWHRSWGKSTTCPRRTLLFWNRIVGGGNAHSFARVRLFPTGTKYPAGTPDLSMPRNDRVLRTKKKVLFACKKWRDWLTLFILPRVTRFICRCVCRKVWAIYRRARCKGISKDIPSRTR